MNSHQRRITNRRWPYVSYMYCNSVLAGQCIKWLKENYKDRESWRWKSDYLFSSEPRVLFGASIFFRTKEDFAWFRLKYSEHLG